MCAMTSGFAFNFAHYFLQKNKLYDTHIDLTNKILVCTNIIRFYLLLLAVVAVAAAANNITTTTI